MDKKVDENKDTLKESTKKKCIIYSDRRKSMYYK